MQPSDRDDVVRSFLESVEGDERPYRRLADLLMLLQLQGWQPDDLWSIQDHVCRALSQHRYSTVPD